MATKAGKGHDKKKRDKYKAGKLCPKCKKGHLKPCDQHRKAGHEHHVLCPVCKDCNF